MRLFFILLFLLPTISKVSLAAEPFSTEVSSPSSNLTLQSYQVEVGKTLTLSSQNPSRNLVASPEVATVTEMRADAIDVKAGRLGSTLVLLWEETGVKTIQIVVIRPTQELERIKEIKLQGSKLYQARRARTFKTTYESEYSILEQDKALARVSEIRKVYNHASSFQGATPWGELEGRFFYEYRKDRNLRKSVALPRNLWFGLFDSDLPLLNAFDHYDFIVGRQYLRLSDFGFPGSRIEGFSMVPTEKRLAQPQKGRVDLSFFIGRERRGAYLDNPAGPNERSVKLKNRFMGEKLDYYLWDKGKVSFGAYEKWAGPTESIQAKKDFDNEYDLKFPYLQLKGQTGVDARKDVALRHGAIFENRWARIENWYLRVNPHYRTITGTTIDRGRRGFLFYSSFLPFMPLFKSDAVGVKFNAEFTRDLLSLNPLRPQRYNKSFRVATEMRLPLRLRNNFSYEYQNKKSTSFPFTKYRISERLTREFILNSWLLKRTRFYGISTIDQYGNAVNTPGFNSIRYELGGGNHVSLFGGLWCSAQYLWNRLDERETNPLTADGRTYPGQLTLSGGMAHSFRKLPLNLNASLRYIDEKKTISKLHQPFLDEDRFEVRGYLGLRLPQNGLFFIETRLSKAKSLVGRPKVNEVALILGTRINADTHFYIPQKGTLEGYFFVDQNMNGIRDPEEEGLGGYEVFVEKGPRTKTDKTGYYRLRVREGVLTLKATQEIPEGYFFTTENQREIELLPKMKERIDFGVIPQTQIKGRTYLDVNRNLIFDDHDIPVPAVQLALDSGELAVTSAEGLYSILRVRPGPNRIRVMVQSIPSGYKTVTPIEKEIEGRPGELSTFDVVMNVERYVSGYVFEDANENGRMDSGEKRIPEVVLILGERKTSTAQDGRYSFQDLEPGVQKLKVEAASLKEVYEPGVMELRVEVPREFFGKTDLNFPLRRKQTAAERREELPSATESDKRESLK